MKLTNRVKELLKRRFCHKCKIAEGIEREATYSLRHLDLCTRHAQGFMGVVKLRRI